MANLIPLIALAALLSACWPSLGGESATNTVSIEIAKSAGQGRHTATYFLRTTLENNSYQVTARKSLFDLINELRPESEMLLFDDEALAENLYDLKLVSAAGADDLARWQAFEKVLKERFSLRLGTHKRKVESMELHLASGGAKGLMNAKEDDKQVHTMVPGGYAFTNFSMGEFADWLSEHLPQPVYDKTGLKGGYSFTLSSYPVPAEAVLAALPKLGLVPKAVTNEVDVLMVEKITGGNDQSPRSAQQPRFSEPGDSAPVGNRGTVAPGR